MFFLAPVVADNFNIFNEKQEKNILCFLISACQYSAYTLQFIPKYICVIMHVERVKGEQTAKTTLFPSKLEI